MVRNEPERLELEHDGGLLEAAARLLLAANAEMVEPLSADQVTRQPVGRRVLALAEKA